MKLFFKFSSVMLLISFGAPTLSAANLACDQAQKNFLSRFDNLQKNYQKYENSDPQTQFLNSNKPYWQSGKNKKIAYLLHGFIGSPYEMKPVADLLKKSGYTVVNDLIPGHGMNGSISNHYDEKNWRSHVKKTLDDLRLCSDQISVIGFSTGALLIHEYIAMNSDFKPESIVFYSPFYKPDLAFLSWIKDFTRWLTATVPIEPLYVFSHYQDIRVAVIDTKHYMQEIPLDTVNVIQKLGQNVYSKKMIHSEQPTLLFVSENDQVANYEISIQKMKSDFNNMTLILFPKKMKIPHHLMVDTVSPVAEKVNQQAADFILQNSFQKK